MNFKKELNEFVKEAVQELYHLKVVPVIEHPLQESHGDYSSNVALVLAKGLKRKPLEIAEEISHKISELNLPFIESCVVVSPGFINFWLSKEFLFKEIDLVNKVGGNYGSSTMGKGKTVVIDYSAPNIAKRFGIGHLRSTVIGQSLYNLYKSLGYRVIGDNHLGDWGTQFGILLYQISSKKLAVSKLTVEELEELYVEFHKEVENQPQMMEGARGWFKKLEEGDKEARRIWQTVVATSLNEFNRVYDLLGVKIDYSYGESFYEDKMGKVIEEIRRKKLSRKSAGAEIVEFKDFPPAILVKSDGATTYFTRDLATIKFRLKEWDPQKVIYEVGADQKLHFSQVFAAAKMLGWIKETDLVHVAHGLIRFAEGKLSTRHGRTIQLEEVLDEANKRARVLIEKSNTLKALSAAKKQEVAQAVGIGAIKYFDLSHQPQTDIIFDWEKLFLLEGNSAPYLQYTYARSLSVLQKNNSLKLELVLQKQELKEAEQKVIRWIYRFPEVIEDAAKSYSPNLICNYLFELAQRFNSFYAVTPILKSEGDVRNFRFALTSATSQVLKSGLTILGIETPERL